MAKYFYKCLEVVNYFIIYCQMENRQATEMRSVLIMDHFIRLVFSICLALAELDT